MESVDEIGHVHDPRLHASAFRRLVKRSSLPGDAIRLHANIIALHAKTVYLLVNVIRLHAETIYLLVNGIRLLADAIYLLVNRIYKEVKAIRRDVFDENPSFSSLFNRENPLPAYHQWTSTIRAGTSRGVKCPAIQQPVSVWVYRGF